MLQSMVSNCVPWDLALPNNADSFSSKKVKEFSKFGMQVVVVVAAGILSNCR